MVINEVMHEQTILHYRLTDPTRSQDYGLGLGYCDGNQRKPMSPDWKGSSGKHYRFVGPSFTRLASASPGMNNKCGTYAPGYIEDPYAHKIAIGQSSTDVKVCFNYNIPCKWSTSITITRCPGDFFVYKLPDTPECSLRYCGGP